MQEFVKDIFSLLASRFNCDVRRIKALGKLYFWNHSTRPKPMVSEGLEFGTVGALFPRQPKFSLERAAAGRT